MAQRDPCLVECDDFLGFKGHKIAEYLQRPQFDLGIRPRSAALLTAELERERWEGEL